MKSLEKSRLPKLTNHYFALTISSAISSISSDYEWNNTTSNDSCNPEYPMLVMVNDVVYKNTGYISIKHSDIKNED